MAICRRTGCRQEREAFTLIEMILAISVIAILSTLTVVAVSKAKMHAETTRSTTAARMLVSAALLASTENNGTFFPAYDATAGSSTQSRLTFRGRVITDAEASHRYPFRLAPYLNDQFEGSIWVGDNYEQITSIPVFSGFFRDYGISMFPAFGISQEMVGGYITRTGVQHQGTRSEAVVNLDELENQLILFASAGQRGSNFGTSRYPIINGYYHVVPPNSNMGSNWQGSRWRSTSDPAWYGNLDARADGKVIVAFTDSSVRLMEVEEMRDMRLWSKNAARLNDPNYNPRDHR